MKKRLRRLKKFGYWLLAFTVVYMLIRAFPNSYSFEYTSQDDVIIFDDA